MKDIDWSKAPEGATDYGSGNVGWSAGFYNLSDKDKIMFHDGDEWLRIMLAEDALTPRPELLPVYTKQMYDAGEQVKPGMEFLIELPSGNLIECKALAISKTSRLAWVITYETYEGTIDTCLNGSKRVKPIDTRSDTEKAIDDTKGFISHYDHAPREFIEAVKGGLIHGITIDLDMDWS